MGDKRVGLKINILELLLLLFVGLKLTGHITWSWWWVLAPMWIPIAIASMLVIIFFIAGGTLNEIKRRVERRAESAPRSKEDPHPSRRIDPVIIHRADDSPPDC